MGGNGKRRNDSSTAYCLPRPTSARYLYRRPNQQSPLNRGKFAHFPILWRAGPQSNQRRPGHRGLGTFVADRLRPVETHEICVLPLKWLICRAESAGDAERSSLRDAANPYGMPRTMGGPIALVNQTGMRCHTFTKRCLPSASGRISSGEPFRT